MTNGREAGVVYVHVVDHSALGAPPVSDTVKASIRARFGGTIILAGGYDLAKAEADLQARRGELVAFGNKADLSALRRFALNRAGKLDSDRRRETSRK